MIELDFPVDTGRIALKENIRLNGTELYEELRNKQAKATFSLIDKYLNSSSSINYEIQTGKDSTYRKISKSILSDIIIARLEEICSIIKKCWYK